jgi:hypothetical protein
LGTGRYGFVYATPASLRIDQGHSIRVRIAGTDFDLQGTPKLINCKGQEGAVERLDCDQISGWAWDRSQPDTPISVDIYDGDNLLATVPADALREDLRSAGYGDGNHGFVHVIPTSLKDGRPHVIRARVPADNTDLIATPQVLTCQPQ